MASKHSSMQMFICMPIHKCAPRLKLQYTVQIQQSEWHSSCTSHQCLAPVRAERRASSNRALSSKTLTKMGGNPTDSEGEETEREQLCKREVVIIVKLRTHHYKNIKVTNTMVTFHAPNFTHESAISAPKISLCKHPAGQIILFFLLCFSFPLFCFSHSPHPCCAVSFFQSLTLPLGKHS